jgi:hypothetical protein
MGSLSSKAAGELQKLEGFATVGVAVQKPMYTAGEIVNGYVQLTVHQPVQIEALDVELSGKAITSVHYTTPGVGNHPDEHKLIRRMSSFRAKLGLPRLRVFSFSPAHTSTHFNYRFLMLPHLASGS